MKFIGRIEELKKLSKIINSENFTATLIFGRRRVGKSELVKYSLKENKELKIYYECKEVSEKSNVQGLSDILSEELNLPQLKFEDIESLLKYIFKLSITKKMILVLDEYSYLKKNN